ncbi:hypothetical protein BDW67DRAFT_191547 [Aspergillus spinulosporus]
MVCLTIAPAFLSAAIYVSLARIVAVYTTRISRIKQRCYSLNSQLVIYDSSTVQAGLNIRIAGLASQGASLTLYLVLCLDLAWRIYQLPFQSERLEPTATDSSQDPVTTWVAFLVFQSLATVCIYIRSVFHVAELSGGFNSHPANDEVAFMVLEGAMISVAAIALSACGHPGIGFQGRWSDLNYPMFSKA